MIATIGHCYCVIYNCHVLWPVQRLHFGVDESFKIAMFVKYLFRISELDGVYIGNSQYIT